MTKDVLAIFGVMFIIFIIAMLGIFLYHEICEKIDDAKRAYRIKHRFDKPPLANCYCVDCLYRNDDGCCDYGGYYDDDHFCGRATLRKHKIKE